MDVDPRIHSKSRLFVDDQVSMRYFKLAKKWVLLL
jgi:hypothetical protein